MGKSRPLFVYFWSFQTNISIFTTNICEKMSIQYTVPGFEPTTFGTWVSSHNHSRPTNGKFMTAQFLQSHEWHPCTWPPFQYRHQDLSWSYPKSQSQQNNNFCIHDSVTRFGKISPLWQNFKPLGNLLDGWFSIWQTFVPTLAFLCYCWANCHCCNGRRLKNN